MGTITAALRELIAAGLTGEGLITAIERIENAQTSTRHPPDSALENRRSWDREYRKNRRSVHPTSTRHPPDPPDALCVEERKKDQEGRKQTSVRARCPPDFILDDASVMHASRMGFDEAATKSEFGRFLDDAAAHDRVYADWRAAFRKWISSPYQRKQNGDKNGHHAANPTGKTASDVAREVVEEIRRAEGGPDVRVLPQIGRQ